MKSATSVFRQLFWEMMNGMEVHLRLKELSKEKNIFLIDNSKKIKAQHLNKGKLHLTKYSSRVLSNNFVNEISKVLYWQTDRLTAKKYDECNITLNTIRSDNVNKLIFAHLNINLTRSKFEVLAIQA